MTRTKLRTTRTLRIIMAEKAIKPVELPAKSPMRTSAPSPLMIRELLELILIQVPPQDLLISAQRVCKRWHATVSACPRIQRALFFAPDEKHRPSVPAMAYTLNPLLARAFEPFFSFDVWRDWATTPPTVHVDVALKSTLEDWRTSMRHPEASWRKMLVTQPPITEVTVEDWRVAPYYDEIFAESSTNPRGVTLGELLLLESELE